MNQAGFAIVGGLLLGIIHQANAYEIATHGAIAKHTYDRSLSLSSSTTVLFNDLGLSELDVNDPFGDTYYDVFDADVYARKMKEYENIIITDPAINENPKSIKGWLMRGAIREDDVRGGGLCKVSPSPPVNDDPYPNIPDRPIHHFYDPINDRGLNQVIVNGEKAIDWVLGVDDALVEPPVENAGRRNHFSLQDAREAQYRALTGRKSSDPVDPNYPVVANAEQIGPGGSVATKAIRDAYWATMFRSLGDVLHLVQDMGQPQHTRNDSHLNECEPFQFLINESIYEAYINARALGESYSLPGNVRVSTKPLVYDTYPVPVFSDAASYFTTRHKDNSILNRRGLADYSNRGFFTAGTNLDQVSTTPEYDYPENNFPSYEQVTLSENWVGQPLPNSAQVILLRDAVPDSLPGGQPANAVPLTTYGVFDQFLEDRGFFKRYSLNRYNYDAMADLLIPRAVSYGAGLLDYYFRGRLAISLPPEGIYGVIDHAVPHIINNNVPEKGQSGGGGVFGFEKVILNVNNITPDIDDGQSPPFAQDIGSGTFRAVAHFRYNPCYIPDLSGEAVNVLTGIRTCDTDTIKGEPRQIVTSEAVALSAFDNSNPNRIEFDFSAEPIPVNAADLKIQVVYYGELGSEANAIAVGMKDISEPSYFVVRNSSDYFSLHEAMYKTDDPAFILAAGNEGISPSEYAEYSTSPGTLTVGNAAGAVQTPLFEPGEFIRIAYLIDYAQIDLVSYIPPVSGYSQTINPRRVSFDQDGEPVFQDISSVGDDSNRLYSVSTFLMTHLPYPAGSQYGDFTNVSNFPVPVGKQVTVCFPTTPCP